VIEAKGKVMGILQEKARETESIFVPGITDVWKEFFDPNEDVGGEIRSIWDRPRLFRQSL